MCGKVSLLLGLIETEIQIALFSCLIGLVLHCSLSNELRLYTMVLVLFVLVDAIILPIELCRCVRCFMSLCCLIVLLFW